MKKIDWDKVWSEFEIWKVNKILSTKHESWTEKIQSLVETQLKRKVKRER